MRNFILYIISNILFLPLHIISFMALLIAMEYTNLLSISSILLSLLIIATLGLVGLIPSLISFFIIKATNKDNKRIKLKNNLIYSNITKFIFSFYLISTISILILF